MTSCQIGGLENHILALSIPDENVLCAWNLTTKINYYYLDDTSALVDLQGKTK